MNQTPTATNARYQTLHYKTTVKCWTNLPTSDRVRTQFSTLKRCDAPSQVHCDIRNAAWSSCTKIGCLVWMGKKRGHLYNCCSSF